MKPSRNKRRVLTAKQRQCLQYVAEGNQPPFKISPSTVESLACKGLVEHTALGWRLTPDGQDELLALRDDAA